MNNTLWIHEGGKSNTKFRQILRRNGTPIGLVWGITEDSEHNIWVRTNGPPSSLIRIQDMEVREEFPLPVIPRSHKLAPDPQNGIWLGMLNGDLARFRSGKSEIFKFGNHLDTPVKSLLAAPDGSILGGTTFGVVGWKNGMQHILSTRNGLPCDEVNMLNADDEGDIWLYAACGLIEIPEGIEIGRWWREPESKLQTRVFDMFDGVQAGSSRLQWDFKSTRRTIVVRQQQRGTGNRSGAFDGKYPPSAGLISMASLRIEKNYPLQEALKLPALSRDLEIKTTRHRASPRRKRFFFATCSRVTTQPGRNPEPGVRPFTTTFVPVNIDFM